MQREGELSKPWSQSRSLKRAAGAQPGACPAPALLQWQSDFSLTKID